MEATTLTIDTDQAAERDLVDFFHAFFRTAIGLDVKLLPDAVPNASLDVLMLPGMGCGTGRLGKLVGLRTPQHIAKGDDYVVISKFSRDFHCPTENGDLQRIAAHQPIAVATDTPTQFVYEDMGIITSVWFAPEELADILPGFSLHALRPIQANAAAAGLLFSYAHNLRQSPVKSVAMMQMARDHLRELALVALGDQGDILEQARNNGIKAARLVELKADVQALFTVPQLSAAALARRHRISARYIQQLFEGTGQTFTEYVNNLRIAFAHRRLTDGRFSSARIADIAYEAGFSDLGLFNRLFRQHYGETPTQARAG